MTTSCIIRHFRRYAGHTILWQQGHAYHHFYTVRHGWASTYRNMPDSITLLDRDGLADVASFDPEDLQEDMDGLLSMLGLSGSTQRA